MAVMLYVRFPLSLRNVEDLLHERGIEISHETVGFGGIDLVRCLQKFAAVHSSVHNYFNQERHFYSRDNFKLNRTVALTEWRQLLSA